MSTSAENPICLSSDDDDETEVVEAVSSLKHLSKKDKRRYASAAADDEDKVRPSSPTSSGYLQAGIEEDAGSFAPLKVPSTTDTPTSVTPDAKGRGFTGGKAPKKKVLPRAPTSFAPEEEEEAEEDAEEEEDDIPDAEKKMPASDDNSHSSLQELQSQASTRKRKQSSPQKKPASDASTTIISIKMKNNNNVMTNDAVVARELTKEQRYKMPDVTRTNGIRQWDSWRRVFSSPQDAFLDLIDNAMDASLHESHHGKVHLHQLGSNGIILINNCHKPIPDLDTGALVVYGSTKNQGGNAKQDAIGENGIGLKHGCAALSDCSIVVTRNHDNISIGILAKRLQTEYGICLPSFSFDALNSRDDVQRHVAEIIQQNAKFSEVVTKDLGNGNKTSGVGVLVDCICMVFHEDWNDDPHVFALIIPELMHAHKSVGDDEGLIEEDGNIATVVADFSRATRSTTKDPAARFLDRIRVLLPKHYINVPQEGFDFFIDNAEKQTLERVLFSYWLHRLVELSKITVYVNTQTPVEEMDDESWATEGQPLNIYFGFDPSRIQKRQKTHMSLYIHSRKSGRLIEQDEDARGILGLANQTSMYSQGFTMIVNDVDGKLPLMPTKQGIAWSEEQHGHTYRHNFHTWLSSVARMYYDLHLKRFVNRTRLRTAIMEHFDNIQQYVSDSEDDQLKLKCLHEADLNTFSPKWQRTIPTKCRALKIFPSCFAPKEDKLELLDAPFFHPGKETLFLFSEKQAKAAQSKPKKTKILQSDPDLTPSKAKRQRRAPSQLAEDASASEDESVSVAPISRKRKAGRKKTCGKRGKKDGNDDEYDGDDDAVLANESEDKTTEIRRLTEELERVEEHHKAINAALQEENDQLKREVNEKDVIIACLGRELSSLGAERGTK